ncbi:gliding motility lipoprotein GldH [Puteibacter caeruleilacunae]|nr:gliding motility lipoprotein GldH [Puteibacter caeruleilacunae]
MLLEAKNVERAINEILRHDQREVVLRDRDLHVRDSKRVVADDQKGIITRVTMPEIKRRINLTVYSLLCCLVLMLVVACDRNSVFDSYQELNVEGWHKDSLAHFSVDITDTITPCDMYVNIRNKGSYPNSNLWLFVYMTAPDGKVKTDTIEYILADPSGKWRGSGLGDLYDNQLPLKSNVVFPVSGSYEVKLQHGMRADVLEGIRDIGIRIEKQD